MGGGKNVSCGMFEAFIFTAALIGGTACSLSSKTMLGLSGEGMTGETEAFSKPIFQTVNITIKLRLLFMPLFFIMFR